MPESYAQNGAALLPGVFSEADLQPVLDQLKVRLELLAASYQWVLPKRSGQSEVRWLSDCLLSLMEKYPEAQGIIYDAMSKTSALHRICSDPRIDQIVSRLMGKDYEVHHRLILLMSPPGGKWHLAGWHQDWYYNEGPHSTMTLWIPLHDVDKSGGAMTIALGKHKEGLFPHVDDANVETKWNTIDGASTESFDRLWDVDVKKGDVVSLHSLTPHKANVNQSPQFRFVLNFRFMDLSDPGYLQAGWRTGEISHARASLGKQQGS